MEMRVHSPSKITRGVGFVVTVTVTGSSTSMAVWVTDSATASGRCGWSSPALFKSDSATVVWDCEWTVVDLSSSLLSFFFLFFFSSFMRFSGCSPLLSRFRQLAYHCLFWRESWAHCSLVKVRAANVFYFILYIKNGGGGGGGGE